MRQIRKVSVFLLAIVFALTLLPTAAFAAAPDTGEAILEEVAAQEQPAEAAEPPIDAAAQTECVCGYPQVLEQALGAELSANFHAADCPLFDAGYVVPQLNLPPYPNGSIDPQTTLQANANYLAFGDSIPFGYGLDSPSDGFVAKLGAKDGIAAANLSANGITSEALAAYLISGAQDVALENADYVTITIGGNDVMAVFYELIAKAYNASGVGKPITAAQVPELLQKNDPAAFMAAMAVIEAGYEAQAPLFQAAFAGVVQNINASVAYIRSKNPAVKIFVTNQYNPYMGLNISFMGKQYDIGGMMAKGVAELNTLLAAQIGGADKVVDIYTPFEASQARPVNSKIQGLTVDLDFHPNSVGHQIYFDALTGLIVGTDVPVPQVKNLRASHPSVGITDTYTLMWDVVDGAQEYVVYKDGKQVAKAEKASYISTGLKAGAKNSYQVSAVVGGVEGEKSAKLTTAARPKAPTNFKYAKKTSTSVTMRWDGSNGANYYRLYQKVGGKFKLVTTIKDKTSYTFTGLKPGTKNYFKVVPVVRISGASIRGASADAKALTR